MSEIKHNSLDDELLYLIGRATSPLTCNALYERCELADEIAEVAKALHSLQNAGKIERVKGPGHARYKLADGVAAPAPAGKVGRPGSEPAADPDAAQAEPFTGVRPAATPPESGPPKLDIPSLADQIGSLSGGAGKTVRREPDEPAASALDEDAIAKGLDLVEERLKAESLADAIIARVKRQLAPTLVELEAAAGLDRLHVHIHIEQVDIHLGGL